MKPDLTISIPKPCPANWDEMIPNELGKFCGLCSLTVVDFTKMSEAEIKEYFVCHYGQKTCGRFNSSQLTTDINSDKNFWEKRMEIVERKYRQTFFRTFLLLFLASVSIVMGCRRATPAIKPHLIGDVDVETMGEPQFEQVDTLKKPDHLIGDTVLFIEKDIKINPIQK
jgi:hypothetical protein